MKYLMGIILFTSSMALAEDGPITFETVYPVLVETHYCRSCHSSQYGNKQAGLDMDFSRAYNNLVGYRATQVSMNRVEPGDPENSYLLHKLKGSAEVGYQMPIGGPYLPEEELELVAEWIRQGALEN